MPEKSNERLTQFEAEQLKAKIFSRAKSENVTIRVSDLATAWDNGLDLPSGTAGAPANPYGQMDLVFACVEKIISGIHGLPGSLSTINDKMVESGAAYDFLFNNPNFNFEQFITDTVGHRSLTRDVFWLFTAMKGRRPLELMVVNGSQMHAITHNRRPDGQLIGWEFRGTGGQRAKFGIEEVWQIRNFNPYDRFHGIGPVTAARLDINYSYAAALFNASCLANGAEMGLILTTEQRMEKEEIEMLRSRFTHRHAGPDNPKRTAILTGGLKPETVAMNMVDLDVFRLMEGSDKKLCAAFGVPPGVVGLITEAQYSHGPAQQDFIFNTILPLAHELASHITRGIISRFRTDGTKAIDIKEAKCFTGNKLLPLKKNILYRKALNRAFSSDQKIFFWFDADQHPTVQEFKQSQAEKVLKFTDAGVPLNSLIEAHNLPYPLTEGGKYNWRSMGEVPEDYTLAAGIEGLTGPSLPEGEGEPKSKELSAARGEGDIKKKDADNTARRKLLIWHAWIISWLGIEREYTEALRKFFLRQQRILLKKLKDAFPLASGKSVVKDTDDVIARVVLDIKLENAKIKVINQSFFMKGSELGIRQSLTEILGLTGKELSERAEVALRRAAIKRSLLTSSHKITSVNTTTQNIVAGQLRQGLDAGEDLNALAARIKSKLGGNRKKAQSIARTQTGGAVSSGRHEGNVVAGVKTKDWVTSGDGQVRSSHVTAGRQKPIPVNERFVVGSDRLMYPGDPAGSAAEIINCRCLEIAVTAAAKSLGLAFYSNYKFYSSADMQTDFEIKKKEVEDATDKK